MRAHVLVVDVVVGHGWPSDSLVRLVVEALSVGCRLSVELASVGDARHDETVSIVGERR